MYPDAYIEYLVYFHGTRDYFECHEVLEDEWKKDPRGERQKYWRGLIQIAVSLYHWRRENCIGAARSIEHAISNLKDEENSLESLALEPGQLATQLNQLKGIMTEEKPYESVNLPITDKTLIKHCEKLCKEKGCIMGNPSDFSDVQILHKHKLPNRDEIISKREAEKRGL